MRHCDYKTIREIKNKVNKALKDVSISNIRVQKRFIKTKYGEVYRTGYAIFGKWTQKCDLTGDNLYYDNGSVAYNENEILEILKGSGLNVDKIFRGKDLEIIIADDDFDWSSVSFSNRFIKFGSSYKVTKTL
jgi:hypothetical protein